MKLITSIVFYFLVVSTIFCQKDIDSSGVSIMYLSSGDVYIKSKSSTDTTGTSALNTLEADYYKVEKVLVYSDKVEIFYISSYIQSTSFSTERVKVIYHLENGKLVFFKKIYGTYVPAKYEYKE